MIKKTRLLPVGLAVLMLLAAVIFVIPAAGVKAAWDGSVAADFAGGNGTEANPYLISNAKELALLAEYVDLGNDTASTYYKLTEDIDVSGGSEWTAIGASTYRFRGIFDGDGHTVSGIYINKPTGSYQGLFGYSEGTIKNVGIKDSNITAIENVGGTVTNCYYNTDFCEFESSCGTGLTTLEMVSGKMTGFDHSVWTNKPIDKAAKTAYYLVLTIFGNDDPIGYETKLDIALSADSETVYGGDYSFDISALVKFDGMTEFKADTTALTTGCGKYIVVCIGSCYYGCKR